MVFEAKSEVVRVRITEFGGPRDPQDQQFDLNSSQLPPLLRKLLNRNYKDLKLSANFESE